MPAPLHLLGQDPISYESAAKKEFNVINQLEYVPATLEQYHRLWQQKCTIAALTKHHLGLGSRYSCTVVEPTEWIRGAFNICIPVQVESNGLSQKFIFRCPMPHKLSEARYAGTVNEKVSCEVGAYVWMQENCPTIRIPHLVGFGFLDGRQFSHANHRPIYVRIARNIRRYIYRILRWPILSHYTQHPTYHNFSFAYILLEHIGPDTGEMLSNTWQLHMADPARRRRLFNGISRIMLSLARIPQPRIGSFRFHTDGTITLTNRPLSCTVAILENDGATRTIERDNTHQCSQSYVSEMLDLHDHRFLNQPNAAFNDADCRGQMAVKTLLRAFSHRHVRRAYSHGPFFLQFTDFHASNIFVDQEWNVTCLIDLEWICSIPTEMLDVPYWLTGRGIDQIQGKDYHEFDEVRQEFMSIFKQLEHEIVAEHNVQVSSVMQDMWESKGMWFWHCLSSVNAMYLLMDHLCSPDTLTTSAERSLCQFWSDDPEGVVRKKLADKKEYDDRLRRLFGEGVEDEVKGSDGP